ncbi:hypothetical protein TUM19329_33210 [Legionella antarctica]|uniref:Uncharacterized protein n=1 Tax=Legionella antarctica TaxID=2708020 RepID=A0A6F8T9X1_9GAMM|nr:hypothetical protein [Legionella antarctica]BCA96960.1 hypothetical protein TUM19329_33210 [Legionella antarctica]
MTDAFSDALYFACGKTSGSKATRDYQPRSFLASLAGSGGSTSVKSFFKPHFSLFDPEHLTSEQHIQLYKRLQLLLVQFSKTHQIKVKATAYAIGVGIADKQGQIVKELDTFELTEGYRQPSKLLN